MHEAAFAYLGGIPERSSTTTAIPSSSTTTIAASRYGKRLSRLRRLLGFRSQALQTLPRPDKGKVENGIGCLRKNFLCGRTALSVRDLSHQLAVWTATVANVRIHGTTHEKVDAAWESEKSALSPMLGRPAYPLVDSEPRVVARDAYVAFRANRCSVPWRAAGERVTFATSATRSKSFRATAGAWRRIRSARIVTAS